MKKYMYADMDLGGNYKMDWFFNEYVYGTSYQRTSLRTRSPRTPSANPVLKFTLSQSDVGTNFVMAVPVYLDFGGGRTIPLGSARMKGVQSIEQHIPLKGLKEKPKRALVAYGKQIAGCQRIRTGAYSPPRFSAPA